MSVEENTSHLRQKSLTCTWCQRIVENAWLCAPSPHAPWFQSSKSAELIFVRCVGLLTQDSIWLRFYALHKTRTESVISTLRHSNLPECGWTFFSQEGYSNPQFLPFCPPVGCYFASLHGWAWELQGIFWQWTWNCQQLDGHLPVVQS